jgi:hypothetical protein
VISNDGLATPSYFSESKQLTQPKAATRQAASIELTDHTDTPLGTASTSAAEADRLIDTGRIVSDTARMISD